MYSFMCHTMFMFSSSQMREEFDAEKQSLQSLLSEAKKQTERKAEEMEVLKTQVKLQVKCRQTNR